MMMMMMMMMMRMIMTTTAMMMVVVVTAAARCKDGHRCDCMELMNLIYTISSSHKQISLLRKIFLIHGDKQMLFKGQGLTVSITRTGLLSCRGGLVLAHSARRLR